MACPRTELQFTESGTEVSAIFRGVMASGGAAMLRSLAAHVRAARSHKVTLDISETESIEPDGLAGLLELDQATEDVKGSLEVRATGPRAGELLATASLARRGRWPPR